MTALEHPISGHLVLPGKPLPNGFIPIKVSAVLQPSRVDAARRIVLGVRQGTYGTEFVTWARREDDHSCFWGHYDAPTLEEALQDFDARVARGH